MTSMTLPADCSREAALALWAGLQAEGVTKPTFDGGAVEKIGQAMVQVLLVAGEGRPIANPSPALADALRLAGLEEVLLGGATTKGGVQ